MKTFAITTILFASSMMAVAQAPHLAHRIEKPMEARGRVELRLASGSYDVLPGASDRIVVSWNDPSGKKPIVHLETIGNTAELQISHTPNGDFHVRVEVPANCDIRARLTAGALNIGPFSGSKDIESRVGEIQIALGEPASYATVDASLVVGELTAKALKETHSGFWRSFRWSGPGRQRLHAKTGFGSITLR